VWIVELFEQDDELVSAESRDRVGVACGLDQPFGDSDENAVPDIVTEAVVDRRKRTFASGWAGWVSHGYGGGCSREERVGDD
jgi:hypothetical protein